MRQSERLNSSSRPTTTANHVEPILGLIDYLLPEVGAIDKTAEYFMRMARESLLESEQARANQRRKN